MQGKIGFCNKKTKMKLESIIQAKFLRVFLGTVEQDNLFMILWVNLASIFTIYI